MTPTTPPPPGRVATEVVDGRILVMLVDRAKKRNLFTPKMTAELAVQATQDFREGIASFVERRDARFVGR
jgi:enoyl-CoA hydratase/carnithine racemase